MIWYISITDWASTHAALILTAVAEDPFDKSVSDSVHWQAQPIAVQLVVEEAMTKGFHNFDCQHNMSQPWHDSEKKANKEEDQRGQGHS